MYSLQFETLYPINQLKRRQGITVTGIDPGGIGEHLGLASGDRILSVNGHKLRDYLDFQFYTGSEDVIAIEIVKRDGDRIQCEVIVEEGDIWGLDFEAFMPRQCGNECIFCFCEQNPADARSSLFFRDEDIRLSFLHGNYTTLTTLTAEEFRRIVEQRLSPQFVSVHATNPEVRRHLLGRKTSDDILGTLKRLLAHNIELHAQIVLCPTINDGAVLRQTVFDLAELHPGLVSIAIVPLGLTKHHRKRHLLTPVSDSWMRETVGQVTPWQKEFKHRLGTPFAFLGDEFYIRAGMPLPSRQHYGGYPQIEDGVGMARRFLAAFRTAFNRRLKRTGDIQSVHKTITIVTGTLFFPLLAPLLHELNEQFATRLQLVPVVNEYFGPEVNVAGLLTGVDYYHARDQFQGQLLLIPSESVMGDTQMFLDGMTRCDLENKLGLEIRMGGVSGQELVDAVFTS